MVNDQLVVTPLVKLPGLSAEAGPFTFEGNVIIEGDATAGAAVEAGGSVFVTGRANSCSITAGNNVLLCGGMFGQNGEGKVKAKGSVWGQFFEMCAITAGGDICANHLSGCEATAEGRANILGGRGQIASTSLYAKNGVVAGRIGTGNDRTVVSAGMGKDLIDHYAAVNQRFEKLSIDINALQQNIVAHERVNRMKPDKGKNDASYREMVSRRDQSLSVLQILETERTKLKRSIDQFSLVSIVAREGVAPGVVIGIDTRTLQVSHALKRTKFRRSQEVIEAIGEAR